MAGEFWLSEAQWGAIGPLLPKNQPGARRTDDRRVIGNPPPWAAVMRRRAKAGRASSSKVGVR
jgi:transposase